MSEMVINATQLRNSLSDIYGLNKAATVEQEEGTPFGTIFQSYLDLYNQTNDLQVSAEQLQLDYAAGRTDDMLAVTLAQEKAYTSLNFTVQVTSKIIEAYREIMRMQI